MSRPRRKNNRPDKLENLPEGSIICTDANILAYHFNKTPNLSMPCTAFVNRCVQKEIKIVTTPQIVADVIHRSMIAETQRTLKLNHADLAGYLKKHPQVVRQLKHNLRIPSLLHELNIDVRPLTYIHHHAAKKFANNMA